MGVPRLFGLLLLGALGCGSSSTQDDPPPPDPDPEPAECLLPNRVVGDLCLEPGFQDDGCPAGTLLAEDGTCTPAGVEEPPNCPPGQMAIVGETTCGPIMNCGAGTWGELPVDGATIYVDASFGGAGNGSETAPFATIAEGITAAAAGGLIAVAAGNYVEDLLIQNKAVQLWGVCPDQVTLTGQGGELAALRVLSGADGTTVGGMTITGPAQIAAFVTGSTNVVLDRLRLADNNDRGLALEGALGPTSVTATRTLIENNREFGVFVAGGAMTLDGVVVRDTAAQAGNFGRGVNAKSSTTGDTALHMVDSVVEASASFGVYVAGAQATIERSVMRQCEEDGLGITVDEFGVPSSAVVAQSLVSANRLSGIFLGASVATLLGVAVRDTQPLPSLVGGRGISVETPAGFPTAQLSMVGSAFERNHNIAIFVGASVADIAGVAVLDTFPSQDDGLDGRAINIENDIASGAPSVATISGSWLERHTEMSLAVLGSEAQITSTRVVTTGPQPPSGRAGRALNLQASISNFVPSTATVTASLLEGSADAGIFAAGGTFELDGLVIRNTSGDGGGEFGDGLLASAQVGATSVALRRSLIQNSARAAISNFGSNVVLEATTLECQLFDIASEPFFDSDALVEDLGGNACGCPPEPDACKAASSGLAPPEPL